MTPAHAGGAPYTVPPEPSRWPSLLLAAAMHLGLLAMLWFGVQWQNSAPVAIEAEVWDMNTQVAAPPPPPAPAPEVTQPEPEPPKAEAPPVEQPPVAKTPDINLEREKRKLEQKKLAEEAEHKAELKKAADEQAARDLAEQKKKDLADKRKKLAEQKAVEQAHQVEMNRILSGAGSTGQAAKSAAPRSDSGYVASLTAKIKSNIAYGGSTDLPGNPRAVYRIEQLPTGDIIARKQIKSSGIPAYDKAVENAIDKSSPLPKKKDGTVERSLELVFDLKELP